MDRQTLYDRIAGCLMGGALGDALGYEIEFLPWEVIRKQYGQVRALVPHEGKARFSDDTQMTLFTNEGLTLGYWRNKTQPGSLTAEEAIYQAYLCWLITQGDEAKPLWRNDSALLREPGMHCRRAPGNTCLSALRSGKMGRIDWPINQSKGCGGVMRSAPAGFTDSWGEPLRVGAASAAITHSHPGGWAPAGVLSDIVHRCIYGEPQPLERMITASLDAVKKAWDQPAVIQFADLAADAVWLSRQETPEVDAIHSLGGGWVGDEALAIALYSCLKHPESVTEALITAVNHSGDSDSTGAIAGNILGALHGLSALPRDWIDQIELADVILRQAEQMTDTVMDHEEGEKNHG